MTFIKMLSEIMNGKYAARSSWEDKTLVVGMRPMPDDAADRTFCIYNAEKDKLFHPCTIRDDDIEAQDWELVVPAWDKKETRSTTPLPRR